MIKSFTAEIDNLIYAGSFGVDSGQAMIGDPCNLDRWKDWDEKEPFDNYKTAAGEYGYLGACGVTITKGYGELGIHSAVAFSTGYGDGVYPVYVQLDENGRVCKVVIDLIGEIRHSE
jgi:hypothetical protein